MGAIAAGIVAIAALLPLLARLSGGLPPGPAPHLAALAPAAAGVALVAVVLAASAASWRLAALTAVPAAILITWQLPPRRRGQVAAADRLPPPGPGPGAVTLRVLTLNVEGGSADAAAIVRMLGEHDVDVFFVQELTPAITRRLARSGVGDLLPFCHLDPRTGSPGTGLWSRRPLAALPPVTGLTAATPRARIELARGLSVTLTAVHPVAPMNRRQRDWGRELDLLRSALAEVSGPQIVAGDFNASRDHRPFRDLLAGGFLDCADAARNRPWPGFTWPNGRGIPPLMRLDHVLVTRAGATVGHAQIIQVPGTDHRGVLAGIDLVPGIL